MDRWWEDAEKRNKALIGALLVIALLVVSFFSGRYSAPARVETREVEKVVWKDKIVEVEKKVEVEKTVEVRVKGETKTVFVDRVITKEGEVREKIVEVIKEVEVEKKTLDNQTITNKSKEESHEGEAVKEVVKTVTLQPDWAVGLQAGASWNKPLVPIAGPLVLGVYGERRIAGGFHLGIWVNTVGAIGGQGTVRF